MPVRGLSVPARQWQPTRLRMRLERNEVLNTHGERVTSQNRVLQLAAVVCDVQTASLACKDPRVESAEQVSKGHQWRSGALREYLP